MAEANWDSEHILKIGKDVEAFSDDSEIEAKSVRNKVEPWLSAVFQSEHLSLLVGSGLTTAITNIASSRARTMDRISFTEFGSMIKDAADAQAKEMARGLANFEDDLRVAMELLKGLVIQDEDDAEKLREEINYQLIDFIKSVLEAERNFLNSGEIIRALTLLKSFLISFASRTASRNRLNIFTTNYDRFIEYGCDSAGILILDRFAGKIQPVFRKNKLELDYHYNPPGIRGEPRYVEGVAKYTKLHGSLDWQFQESEIIKALLPFGADETHPGVPENVFDHAVVYPNPDKAIETSFYPYSELFRDFSNSICQKNSTIVTYGYGFGDSHVNSTLKEMLIIPSTHIVIISWDKAEGRVQNFVETINPSQATLLVGSHFGDLQTLVNNYLPKAAIDRISERKHSLLEKRGEVVRTEGQAVDEQNPLEEDL